MPKSIADSKVINIYKIGNNQTVWITKHWPLFRIIATFKKHSSWQCNLLETPWWTICHYLLNGSCADHDTQWFHSHIYSLD